MHSLDFDIEGFQERVHSVHPLILVPITLSTRKSATEKYPPERIQFLAIQHRFLQ